MLPLQSLPAVFDDPRIYAALVVFVGVVLLYQQTLSWSEYKRLHAAKLRILPFLDRFVFTVSNKRYRDDAEYIDTVGGTVGEVFERLVNAGGSPHLVNSVKRRPLPDGEKQYSAAHVVWNYADVGEQVEAYLFENPGAGTVDVYAHTETWTLDPDGHLTDPQTDGDPRGVVRRALE